MLMIPCIALAAVAGSIISEGFVIQGTAGLIISIIFAMAQLNKKQEENA